MWPIGHWPQTLHTLLPATLWIRTLTLSESSARHHCSHHSPHAECPHLGPREGYREGAECPRRVPRPACSQRWHFPGAQLPAVAHPWSTVLCWGLGTWWGSCAPDRPQRGWQRAQGPELGVGRQPLEPEASSEPCSLRWTSGRAPPTWGPSATCCHPRLGLRGHCAGENGVTLHGADLSPTLRGESRSWAQGGWGAHHPETGPLSIGFPDQGVVGPAQRGQWALAGVPVHAGLPAALHWPHLVQVPALLQG